MFGKKNATPEGLKRAFIVVCAATYVISVVQLVTLMLQQIQTNPNLSSSWPLVLFQTMPLAFFGLAYFLTPRKKVDQLQRVFESVLIAVIGLGLFTVLSQVATYIVSVGSTYESFIVYQIVLVGGTVLGFAGVLYFLAKTKRWK